MKAMSGLPVDSIETPRFCGLPTFMRLRNSQDLEGVDVAVIGLPSDNGAPFRNGSRFGPSAMRSISSMLRPINPYQKGLNVFEVLNVVDYGDSPLIPGYFDESYELMESFCRGITDKDVMTAGMGGDHSVTLPQVRALAKSRGKPLAVVHFDAHSDTWDSYFGSKKFSAGTFMRRGVEENLILPGHSIQIGMRGSHFRADDNSQSLDLGYEMITNDMLFEMGIEKTARRILERTAGYDVFITFDLDFVDPSAAPGVATPEAGGPGAREALQLVRLLRGVHIVGCDVVELCPGYDNAGQITALLGATVLAEFLALAAYHRVYTSRGL
jgi:agmatinase